MRYFTKESIFILLWISYSTQIEIEIENVVLETQFQNEPKINDDIILCLIWIPNNTIPSVY